jgi:hypothetical protein
MKRLLYTFVALAVLFLSSCLQDVSTFEKLNNGKLRLKLEIESLSTSGAATKATVAPEEGEDMMRSLYLLFFEPNAFRNGAFIDFVEVEIPAGGINMKDHPNFDVDIDLNGTSLNANAAYNILAVANIFDDLYTSDGEPAGDWVDKWSGMTERQAMETATGVVVAEQSMVADALLMNGRVEKAANQVVLNLSMTRNMVRIDINNSALRTEYDLVSASIWNAYSTSSVWGEGVMDYSARTPRIERFYGISNLDNILDETADPLLGNIVGGLYTFENQVASPESHDKVTTCLIIGLRNRVSGDITYYRANVHADGSNQALRRNHVYRISITGVSGPGADNEELAYLGRGNTIKYTVGAWNLDDNGLIVQDDYSILSIPVKTIGIGRDASQSTFSIYTFTTLTDAAPLTIRNQTYTPAGNQIRASLDGNTLVIDADAMGLMETERRGVITLSFAGLETSISIVQSGTADDFLRVYLPEGGIPRFLSFSGQPSGLIRVEASGPWTAQLYMEGFTFSPQPEPSPVLKTIYYYSGVVQDNRFRVYTWSHNNDVENLRVRDAFIVVTLDKDPETFASVVRLSQAPAGLIRLLPAEQEEVLFDGVGNLVNRPGMSNVKRFQVLPGITAGVTNEFFVELRPIGGFDDTDKFTPIRNYDPSVGALPENNWVQVDAKGTNGDGLNTSGRTYRAIMRVYRDAVTYTDIEVIQQPADLRLSSTSVTAPAGGMDIPMVTSQTVTVNIAASAQWEAHVVSVTPSVDNFGNPITATILPSSGNGGQSFTVELPRNGLPFGVQPQVVVRVNYAGTTVGENLTVTQAAAPARIINFAQSRSGGGVATANAYGVFRPQNTGTLGGGFPSVAAGAIWSGHAIIGLYDSWRNTNVTVFPNNTTSYGATSTFRVFAGTNNLPVTTATQTPGATISVYAANAMTTGDATANGVAIRNWLEGADNRVLLIMHDANYAFVTNLATQMGAGYGYVTPATAHGVNTTSAVRANRYNSGSGTADTSPIHDYLFRSGPFSNGTDISQQVALAGYDPNGSSISSWPSTFVPILYHPTNGNCVFGIDPVKRVIYIGKSGMFGSDYVSSGGAVNWTNATHSAANAQFVRNVAAFIVNVVQWDELFLEQFIP